MNQPSTRASLLLRLRDHQDADAWEEFIRLYRPVILRVAAARGMQPAEAEDLAQSVLVSVSRAIERFDPTRGDAKFRTWLRRITDNAILNALTRGSPDRGSGDDDVHDLLRQQPTNDSMDSQLIRTEYRREVFWYVAKIVRTEFTSETWASEQAKGEAIDTRTDLFSLGSVLYTMAAGRPPFRAESPYAIIRKVVEQRPRGLSEINSRIPGWFQTLVDRLHAKRPSERLATAGETAQMLEACLAHVQTGKSPLPELIARRSASHRRRRIALATLLIVPLLLILAGWFSEWTSDAGRNQSHIHAPDQHTWDGDPMLDDVETEIDAMLASP